LGRDLPSRRPQTAYSHATSNDVPMQLGSAGRAHLKKVHAHFIL
jgi:hypothetical protein